MPSAVVRLALAAGLVLAACGGESGDPGAEPATSARPAQQESLPVPVQELDFVADEYSFRISPDPAVGLRPGWTTIRFRNDGAEAHQVMFARLKDGVDMSELAAAGAGDSSGAGAIEFVDMLGGVSYIGPDREITAMVDLPSGTVLAMCYVPTPEGVAHALLGMSSVLDVGADDGEDGAETATGDRPEVLGTIEMGPEGYRIPSPLESGWYRVENTDEGTGGEGLHELSLLRLERPLDADEVDRFVGDLAANVVPDVGLEALGGLGAISPGFEAFLLADLTPGDYLAVDFMPDPGDPRPHMLDGYHTTFRQ